MYRKQKEMYCSSPDPCAERTQNAGKMAGATQSTRSAPTLPDLIVLGLTALPGGNGPLHAPYWHHKKTITCMRFRLDRSRKVLGILAKTLILIQIF